MQAYSDPSRESGPYAFPDVEVFHVTVNRKLRPDFDYSCECGYSVCMECGRAFYPMELDGDEPASECCQAYVVEPGWYWWSCFPGCLPDGEPNGPFATQAEALADAQQVSDDGIDCADCGESLDDQEQCHIGNETYCRDCAEARREW